MRKEAEVHRDEDEKQRSLVELKNECEQLIYTTEKLISDNSAAVAESDQTRLNAVIDRLKTARDNDDVDGMKKAKDELQSISQEIGKAIYEKAAASGGVPGGEGAAGDKPEDGDSKGEGDENVIDADYEVKG